MREIDRGRDILRDSEGVIVLTGAGLSVDSGLTTFRGSEGHWKKHRPEDLATPESDAMLSKYGFESRIGTHYLEPEYIKDFNFFLKFNMIMINCNLYIIIVRLIIK